MDLENAQRQLAELRVRPMYVGEPEFGYFRYDEMISEMAGLIVHIESFRQHELSFDRTMHYARKSEVIEQIKTRLQANWKLTKAVL